MTKDLTKGTPWKVMIQFGIPLLIGNIIQQLYNIADTIMIGNALDMQALAAVGSTGAMSFFILGFCMGISGGFAVPIAQAFGAKDMVKLRKTIGNSVLWCTVVSIVVTTLACVFSKPLLVFLKTPDDILEQANTYIFTIYAGISATMIYNMSSNVLRSVGDSKTPLVLLIISAILNVGMNYLFLYIIPMGVFGAAFATVLAQLISGIACVVFTYVKFTDLRVKLSDFIPDWNQTRYMFSIGLPMALQFSITAIGSMMIQSSVNSLGTTVVGANTAASRACNIAMTPVTALGSVMSTYAAQNYGAAEYDRIRVGVKQSNIIMLIIVSVSTLFCLTCGRPVMKLFSSTITEEEIRFGLIYMYANGIFFFEFGLLHIFRTTLQGIGISLIPLIGGFVELLMRVGLSVLCMFLITKLDATAMYWIISMASPLAWFGADATLITRYLLFTKRLKKKMKEMEEHPETRHRLTIKEL